MEVFCFFQAKEKVIGNVYVIEPYGLIFTKNIEVQIPLKEFDGNTKNLDVLRFEPTNGVYLKLPNNIDTDTSMMKFQSDVGGVYVFVEKESNVSLIRREFQIFICFFICLAILDCWCSYTCWNNSYYCYCYSYLF